MQLVEAGKVDLGAGLSRYLSAFSDRPAGAVTLRRLLSHTSGYSTLQGNASRTDVTGSEDELARRVEQLAQVAPDNPPDETWAYSNTNYEILGRLVEVVSGQEFQAYVARNILQPVGMTNSFVADGAIHEAMATGHTPWFGTKRPLPESGTSRSTALQGGVVASANDLARYLQMMMNGEDDVLSADGKSLMMRPASCRARQRRQWIRLRGNVAPAQRHRRPCARPRRRRRVRAVPQGVLHRSGGHADHLPPQHDLGLASPHPGSRQVHGRHLRPVQPVVPLLTTLAAAWVLVGLVPALLGTPLGRLSHFSPDLVVVLVASAVTGVLWAAFRLGVAYTGRMRPSPAAGRAPPG